MKPLEISIGWTVLHSLWEGALVSAALACVLAVTRSPRIRYAAACVAMLVLVAGFGITLVRMMPQKAQATGVKIALWPASGDRAGAGLLSVSTSRLAALVPWVAPVWIAGVCIFYLRNLAGWMSAQRLRRRGVCCAPAHWQTGIARWSAQFRISRPVLLLESCFAEAPLVLGHFRPVILVPIGMLTGLPAEQIGAILLHELAHIRRCDYLVNLLQTFAEGWLFYHPAVWWMSGVIRAERENCCDDAVIAAGANAREYASALARLEQNRRSHQALAAAATGGNLVKRIRRLLSPESSNTGKAPIFAAAMIVIFAGAIFVTLKPAAAQNSAGSPGFEKWLNEDVAYIITAQERAAFLKLTTDEERERFVEDFWLRRDPTPGTPENEFKEEHYRRIAFANQHFPSSVPASSVPGWKTDRGRIYITFGPPDQIAARAAGADNFVSQSWTYRYIGGIGSNISVAFIDRTGDNDYRLAPGSPQ